MSSLNSICSIERNPRQYKNHKITCKASFTCYKFRCVYQAYMNELITMMFWFFMSLLFVGFLFFFKFGLKFWFEKFQHVFFYLKHPSRYIVGILITKAKMSSINVFNAWNEDKVDLEVFGDSTFLSIRSKFRYY